MAGVLLGMVLRDMPCVLSTSRVDDVVAEDYFSYKDYVPSLLFLLLPVFSADDESDGMAVVYAVENAIPHDIVGVISPPIIGIFCHLTLCHYHPAISYAC